MTLPEMIDVATRGSASRSGRNRGGHLALVDVVRIACDGCELDALTTSDATRALKERVKQLLLEVRYGTSATRRSSFVRGRVRSGAVRGGVVVLLVVDGEVDDGDDADVADDEDGASSPTPPSVRHRGAVAQSPGGRRMACRPFHKEVEIVDVSREHHVGHHGGSDPLRKGVTVKRKSVGFFGSLFGGGGGGGARGAARTNLQARRRVRADQRADGSEDEGTRGDEGLVIMIGS